MQTFDWIVVGNGLAGAALGYELSKQGLSVLLIEQSLEPESATRYSYGGIPYWSGTTQLTTQLNEEGIIKHRQLSNELGANTEFRELDLILTIPATADADAIASAYDKFTGPQRLSAAEVHEREPLIKAEAIAGAVSFAHAHVSPRALVRAYNQAMQRHQGMLVIAPVTGLVRIKDKVTGVTTETQAYAAKQVAIAAGAFSRTLLQQARINVPVYFTHAELIQTPPLELKLRSLVMPAATQRFQMEAKASRPETEPLWQVPGYEVVPPVLDSGVIQFQDGSLRIGQISRSLTALDAPVDSVQSEHQLRTAIGQQMPALQEVPGSWHRCHVSFSRDSLPLVGPIPGVTGVHVFTGFSSPFSLLPPIAERFAQSRVSSPDPLLEQMLPSRFSDCSIKQ